MPNWWEDSKPFQARETCIALIYQWQFGILKLIDEPVQYKYLFYLSLLILKSAYPEGEFIM